MVRNTVISSIVLPLAFSAFFLVSCGDNNKTPMTTPDIRKAPTFTPRPFDPTVNDGNIDALIAQMTLEEKIGMLHANTMFTSGGVDRLGIPKLYMADGPLGIREEISEDSWAPAGWDNDFATYYPAAGAVAATWNPELSHLMGASVGEEARARGKDMLLSPAINIIRTPVGGRTYEYFTEDPFLNRKMAVPFVVGVQDKDVMACVKHYAVNNQETNRDFVDVLVDERTLREIYLPAFKATVVEANAYSMMGAYNKFRGEYLCENDYMLNTILREEWGFEGVVVSDWAAVHSTVKSLENGLDIEMGTRKPFDDFFLADALVEAARAGKITEDEIDKHVKRILRVLYQVKAMGGEERTEGSLATAQHFQDAYAIASEAIVLLKNEANALPLNLAGVQSIAVIGNNAIKKNALAGFGAGVKTKKEVTPLEGLQNRLPSIIEVKFAEGYQERYSQNNNEERGDITHDGPKPVNELDPDKLEEALRAAREADQVVIFAGSNRDFETEAADRLNLDLPFAQEELIEKVIGVNPNTIVVMIGGGPFDLRRVENLCPTIVWSWFNGSEGGHALADVLLGNVNPSGKLPWTLPKQLEDSPAHATNSFPGDKSVSYAEGILVGYRWFDTRNVEPLYPFGHGLSYTTFALEEARVDNQVFAKNDTIWIDVRLKNTGPVKGKEVVQVYVGKPNSVVPRAAQELKGFRKVEVEAGETEVLSIPVAVSDLDYYDVTTRSWVVEPGQYNLFVGNSSRNIWSTLSVEVK